MAAHVFSPRSKALLVDVNEGPYQGSVIQHTGGPQMCAACNTSVDDGKTAVAVRALGKQWHKECFTCWHCKHAISAQFSSHEGKPYCDPCFEKHVSKAACPGCRKLVHGHFVKALGREWHRECFVCEACKKPFQDNVYESAFPLFSHTDNDLVSKSHSLLVGEDNAAYHPNC